MSSFSDTVDSIKITTAGIKPTVDANQIPSEGWMAKISKGGAELKAIQSTIAEQTKAYLSTMIPQTIPNTTPAPNAGSLAAAIDAGTKKVALATDDVKTAAEVVNFTALMTKIHTSIDTKKNEALGVLEAKKNALPNARRQSQLYADAARDSITDAKTKVTAEADLKKELVKF